ncbi:MAG: cytochrome c-type biogenesis protein CcmH [candidate division KSB1 bacterium]|nr:cytochrome c-type biogenesis protein CcmH [candidate division KSB1 bacterium]
MRTKTLSLMLLVLLVFTLSLQAQNRPTLQEIKTSLICQCGCAMTVEACQGAMACNPADQLTAEAQQLIDQGLDKKAILAVFVNKYGEQILSAPAKKGFNLTAWITPFFAILISGFSIVKIVQKWSHRQAKSSGGRKPRFASDQNEKYEKMLDEVLRDLD